MSTDYDVIVAGGGTAGTAAAIAAARDGARTLLIERHGCLGGAAAVRNVLTLCGLYTLGETAHQAVGGIPGEVIDRLRQFDAITPPQRFRGVFATFEPEALKRIFDQMTEEAGVDTRFGAFVTGATRDGDRIALDVEAGTLSLLVEEEELRTRRKNWTPPAHVHAERGYAKLYFDEVLQAEDGCDFNFLRAVPRKPEA